MEKISESQVKKSQVKGWVKKDDKEIPVKLENLEFLIEFFDYQRLIAKGDEFNLIELPFPLGYGFIIHRPLPQQNKVLHDLQRR